MSHKIMKTDYSSLTESAKEILNKNYMDTKVISFNEDVTYEWTGIEQANDSIFEVKYERKGRTYVDYWGGNPRVAFHAYYPDPVTNKEPEV